MRYATHLLLARSEVEIPRRAIRDSFGLGSAGCWCCVLTSPIVPTSHQLRYSTEHPVSETPDATAIRPETDGANELCEIELSELKGSARPVNTGDTSDLQPQWQTNPLPPPPLIPLPPTAHCRQASPHIPKPTLARKWHPALPPPNPCQRPPMKTPSSNPNRRKT